MPEALTIGNPDTPPVAPAGSEFDFSSQSLTPDVTAMNGSPDSPFAADPGMPTGPVNTVDTAPPEPTTPDAPPTSNPSRPNPTPTDGGRSRSRRRPAPDASPSAPDSGSTPPTPPESPTNPPSGAEAGRPPRRAPRLRRLGASALIGAGTYAALRNGLFDGVHDRLDSTIGENASEVADIAVVSSVLAITSLRLFTAKVRANITKTELAIAKSSVSAQIKVFEAIRKSKEIVWGELETPTLDPEPGSTISRKHARSVLSMNTARDKVSAEIHENSGMKRHAARRVQGSTVHTVYKATKTNPGLKVTIPTSEPGLGSEQHFEDIDEFPRTKKERKMHHEAIMEEEHIQHEAHEIKDKSVEATVGTEEWLLNKYRDRQDVLALKLKDRKKAVKAIEKRKDARSQTYDRAKRQVSRGVSAASTTIRNDIRLYRARIRR